MDKKKKNDQKDDVRSDINEADIPDLNETKKEVQALRAEQVKLEDQLKRAVADYHNLEKRVAEGRSELTTWATGELISRILPSLDHLEKALKGASEAERGSGWLRGVELSVKQLEQVLQSEGLEQIEADGQFDPALHEAVDSRDGEHDKILEVVEKG